MGTEGRRGRLWKPEQRRRREEREATAKRAERSRPALKRGVPEVRESAERHQV